jgi:hypothetical protein
MAKVTITIPKKELKEFAAKLEKYKSKMLKAVPMVVNAIAEDIMGDSKENFVPVCSGVLRSSGHVQRIRIGKNRVTVRMGYGGSAASYALAVHERMQPINRCSQVGGAKYLSLPFDKAKPGMPKRFIRGMNAIT